MSKKWIIHGKSVPEPDYRMILFHHAGGSAASYLSWKKYASERAELCPVQLPMRENRIHEAMPDNIDILVKDFIRDEKELFSGDYVLFGHSMGGIFALETAREVKRLGLNLPLAVFISSCNPPKVSDVHDFSDLSDEKLKNILKDYGLMQEDILNAEDYLEYYLPIARADFMLCESYNKKPDDATPLDCPLILCYGTQDAFLKYDELDEWKSYTNSVFSKYSFDGGHFYHFENGEKVCGIIDDVCNLFS